MKSYENATIVELGSADEIVLGPDGDTSDEPLSGEYFPLADVDE